MVRFGVYLPQAGVDFEVTKRIALEAESLGYDSIWLSDHLQPANPKGSYLECWTTLSALAAVTQDIRLGTLVLCNLFRNPAVLAKMAATLDHISGGRLEFGFGAGWNGSEASAYGVSFPALPDLLTRFQEALEVIIKVWTEDNPSFEGRFYRISGAYCNPGPVQKPHPPIWIGTMLGRKRMLKLAARYADGWVLSSVFLPTPEEYGSMQGDLLGYCSTASRRIGRFALGVGCIIAQTDKGAKEKAALFPPSRFNLEAGAHVQRRIEGTPEQCIEQLAQYTRLGVTDIFLNFPDNTNVEPLRLFAQEVMPAFTKV